MSEDGLSLIADVFGKRYGEILLVSATPSGPEAKVFNTFPLNDCPADLWEKLDPQAIAKQNGVAAALLNGPRYWLMSSIDKRGPEDLPRKTFGGIEMPERSCLRHRAGPPTGCPAVRTACCH